MNQWMNSPGHKANILTKDYKSIGIGCFKNGSVYYWVQCFGIDDASKAVSKTGTQNTVMTIPISKQKVDLYAYTIKNASNYNYMKPSETGYIRYGIKNAGWNQVYSPGVESDFGFSSSNTNVVTIDSKGNFKAVGEGTATIKVYLKSDTSKVFTEKITVKGKTKISADKCKTTLSTMSYTYNGKSKKPTVKVKYGNKALKEGKDYTLTYANGRKKVGKYEVKVKFKGNYTGTKKLYFTINPKGTSISKLTSGKRKFTAKWKKQTTQTTGYQVQYSMSSKFKNAKTEKITKNKTTSKTISKLKSNKKYYVKVRTYKVVNGKTYYSSWTSAKSVKTKR
ncbi:MAG: hypothetical protein HFJ17_00405 [Clostridia bacterium]|nr:hypothetical protein [Clostridia bacterium]